MLEAKRAYGGQVMSLVLPYVDSLWFSVDYKGLERMEIEVKFTAEFYNGLSEAQKEVLQFAFPEIKEAVDRWEETEPQEDENLPKIITSEE